MDECKYICPVYKWYYCKYHEKMVKKKEKDLKEATKPMFKESVTIGKYILEIRTVKNFKGESTIFIHKKGEGMVVDTKTMEKLIDKFYKKNS